MHGQADPVSAACCEQVPAGHVWLQGDNTLNSTDSRHYGPVPYALLKGRAFCKVYFYEDASASEARVMRWYSLP